MSKMAAEIDTSVDQEEWWEHLGPDTSEVRPPLPAGMTVDQIADLAWTGHQAQSTIAWYEEQFNRIRTMLQSPTCKCRAIGELLNERH